MKAYKLAFLVFVIAMLVVTGCGKKEATTNGDQQGTGTTPQEENQVLTNTEQTILEENDTVTLEDVI